MLINIATKEVYIQRCERDETIHKSDKDIRKNFKQARHSDAFSFIQHCLFEQCDTAKDPKNPGRCLAYVCREGEAEA